MPDDSPSFQKVKFIGEFEHSAHVLIDHKNRKAAIHQRPNYRQNFTDQTWRKTN